MTNNFMLDDHCKCDIAITMAYISIFPLFVVILDVKDNKTENSPLILSYCTRKVSNWVPYRSIYVYDYASNLPVLAIYSLCCFARLGIFFHRFFSNR